MQKLYKYVKKGFNPSPGFAANGKRLKRFTQSKAHVFLHKMNNS